MARPNHQTPNTRDRKSTTLQDLYIEFLGALIPGLFTVVLASSVLAASWLAFCQAFCPYHLADGANAAPAGDSLDVLRGIPLGPYGTVALILVLAYVLGFIFYRQDPKVPDYKSAKRIWRRTPEAEKARLAAQPTSKGSQDLAPDDVQFPYLFIHEYLEGRGLTHLASWVPWKGQDPTTWNCRTKMFINLLKIRLQYLVPERCKDIVRNEAHVRLSTSLWYGTNWLIVGSSLATLVAILAIARSLCAGLDYRFLAILGYDLVVFLVAVLIRHKIENFIHYLRVREVVYVLESAHFATVKKVDLHREDIVHLSDRNRSSQVNQGRA